MFTLGLEHIAIDKISLTQNKFYLNGIVVASSIKYMKYSLCLKNNNLYIKLKGFFSIRFLKGDDKFHIEVHDNFDNINNIYLEHKNTINLIWRKK